jgi:hypothetical protein
VHEHFKVLGGEGERGLLLHPVLDHIIDRSVEGRQQEIHPRADVGTAAVHTLDDGDDLFGREAGGEQLDGGGAAPLELDQGEVRLEDVQLGVAACE